MAQKRSWQDLEAAVREIASLAYDGICQAENIGGVDIDAVVRRRPDYYVLIEVTERKDLNKVREDIIKLTTAKHSLLSKNIFAQCICVVGGTPTQSMKDAGKPNSISVVNLDAFSKNFLDFRTYEAARSRAHFGSAINPQTGQKDNIEYVDVKYFDETNGRDVGIEDIANLILSGKNVILLGEFGSGKSRCIEQIWTHLAKLTDSSFLHPVAINLRESWGLRRDREIIRRHFSDLGLDKLEAQAVQAYNERAVCFLLDGFDELGSQTWSNDPKKIRQMRQDAMIGVAEIVSNNGGGVLVAGREHYFTGRAELFSALCINAKEAIIIKCRPEFSEAEAAKYFERMDIDVDLPIWLPRRPLVCQTISTLDDGVRDRMFSEGRGQIDFWHHFISEICSRDARIHASFDAQTIMRVYLKLARETRMKTANMGPIKPIELQDAFEDAVGFAPTEQASVMLQRLPSLGRIQEDSDDLQFVDTYILDGLRALDISNLVILGQEGITEVLSDVWVNPLEELGQRILAADQTAANETKLAAASFSIKSSNKVFSADLISALARAESTLLSYNDLVCKDLTFLDYTFSEKALNSIRFEECIFSSITLPDCGADNVSLDQCYVDQIRGAANIRALPVWMGVLNEPKFEEVATTSQIRRLGMTPPQEVLITIIKKTFFQKGSGRKEAALTRGLNQKSSSGIVNSVINILLREGMVERFKGNEGWVYSPVRKETKRMSMMLEQLSGSEDPIWSEVSTL